MAPRRADVELGSPSPKRPPVIAVIGYIAIDISADSTRAAD